MSEQKVVGIHGGRPLGGKQGSPLPSSLIKLRDLFKSALQEGFRKLFDNADDALFALADKAGSNGDQALYFDAMRELRLQKKHIASHCVKEIVFGFNHISDEKEVEKKQKSDDLLEWSLLENDELEIKVAVDSMVSRVESNSGTDLKELNSRVTNLMSLSDGFEPSFPFSTRRLCDEFILSCKDLDFSIRTKLVVLKLFEKYVLSTYPKLYADSNQLLINHKVSVRQAPKKKDFQPSLVRGKGDDSPSVTNNSFVQSSISNKEPVSQEVLGHSAQQNVPVLGSNEFIESECGSQFHELRSLLHLHEEAAPRSGIVSDNVVYINQASLLDVLNDEQHLNARPDYSGAMGFQELINSKLLINESNRLNDIDADVINLVSMLFDFILDDRQLQPEMKALISRLQIPILKVAILDRGFFDRSGHAARRLLNEMASAAIGWSPQAEGKKDSLKDKMTTIVDRILNEFDNNVQFFNELLIDFETFIQREKRRGELVEQRTKDSENGKALTQRADDEISALVKTLYMDIECRGDTLHDEVKAFVEDQWKRVLKFNYLKHGESSKELQEQVGILKNLLYTVCPDRTDFDARGKMLGLIPSAVAGIKAGLREVSLPETTINQVISLIESVHIDVLNALQNDEVIHKAEIDDESIADLVKDTMDLEQDFKQFFDATEAGLDDAVKTGLDNVAETVKANEESLLQKNHSSEETESNLPRNAITEMNQPEADLDKFIKQSEKFSVGTWFEFETDNGAERCKLAAIIKSIGKYIFVNRSGVKVAEHNKEELAKLLRSGSLQALNDGLLFDRALESVIGSLRSSH